MVFGEGWQLTSNSHQNHSISSLCDGINAHPEVEGTWAKPASTTKRSIQNSHQTGPGCNEPIKPNNAEIKRTPQLNNSNQLNQPTNQPTNIPTYQPDYQKIPRPPAGCSGLAGLSLGASQESEILSHKTNDISTYSVRDPNRNHPNISQLFPPTGLSDPQRRCRTLTEALQAP